MSCFDVDSGDEGERRKDGGEGHTGMIWNFPIQDEGLKKGISEKDRPSARVGQGKGGKGVCRCTKVWSVIS